ncbi:MAG: hypothetical protein J3Q66DRAFT_432259 [Benniella sp.]|nr:MAG: hypothetical protein J3Q66DRAFT_432259 [Benniella sp.]
MPQSPSSPSIFTFFIFTLTCLFCISSSPSVLAQKYRPVNLSSKCNAFVEGQALYLDYFVLDLSVPWNASDPGFKKLMPHPDAQVAACAITSNGEDLFVMSAGTGYIYNVKSNSWKPFPNPNFAPYATEYFSAVTDPETGIIYLLDGGVDFAGRKVMLSVDIRTGTVITTGSNPYMSSRAVWNEYLRSMVVAGKDSGLMVFTLSNVTGASDGWGLLSVAPPEDSWYWDCGASAYGGSMMIFISYAPPQLESVGNTVYILDVVKQTWKRGPPVPGARRYGSSCAVSGDQFIVWGGSYEEYANRTRILNLKTEKWVSRYTPPPPRPTATILQPSQTPATASESGNTSSNEKRLVIIIVAVTVILLAIILGLIFKFYRRTRQLDPNESSRGPLDIRDSVKTSRPGLVGRLHQGVFGAKQVSEHPHAIVEDPTMKRNIQEGALEIQIPPQHPHTMVGRQEFAFQLPPQHPHAIEGQAFYLLGGFRHYNRNGNFMIDLSVPWNASDPVYKELKGGPIIEGHGCGMANTGDLFMLSVGTGLVYNLNSNSWTVFDNANLSTSTFGEFGVTDPETGIIYIKDKYVNFNGESTMYSIDMRTKTVNTSKVYLPEQALSAVAWSAFRKSVVVVGYPVYLYTPSEVTGSSKGQSTFVATGPDGVATGPDGDFPNTRCTAPAYGGSIIVFLGDYLNAELDFTTHVYFLDLKKRNWRKGPRVNARIVDTACAVSGDYFIVWGGIVNGTESNKALVFNIKTEKKVSRYIPPPPRPTTTTLQPSQTPATVLESGNTSSNDKTLVIIIVAVAGTLMAIILGLIFKYRTRRLDPNGPSTGSLDIKDDNNASGRGDPSDPSHARLHEGSYGAQLVSEHPHAIVGSPISIRGVQEGALSVQVPPQHPQVMVNKQEFDAQIPPQHPHAIGKQELEDQ